MYSHDNRVVITLDAGGTNLVFGAMQANKFIVDPITLPSNADNLDKCLATMVEGFQAIIDKLEEMGIQDGDIVSLYDLEFEYQR